MAKAVAGEIAIIGVAAVASALLISAFAFSGTLAAADIYQCPGPDGSVRFSDQPCAGNGQPVAVIREPLAGDARCAQMGQIAYNTALQYKRGIGKVKILAELGADADDLQVRRAVDVGYQYGYPPESLKKQAQAECLREQTRRQPGSVSAPATARDFTVGGKRYRLTRLAPWVEMENDIQTDRFYLQFRAPKPEWAQMSFSCTPSSPDDSLMRVGTWAENVVVARVKPSTEPERDEWQVPAGKLRIVKAERPFEKKVADNEFRYANAYGLLADGMRCQIIVEARYRGGDAIRNAEAMIRGLQPL